MFHNLAGEGFHRHGWGQDNQSTHDQSLGDLSDVEIPPGGAQEGDLLQADPGGVFRPIQPSDMAENWIALNDLSDVTVHGSPPGSILRQDILGEWVAESPQGLAADINLGDLSDVDVSTAVDGDVLTREDGLWVNKSHRMGDHSDASFTYPEVPGQVPRFNGSSWVNQKLGSGDVENNSNVDSGSGSVTNAFNTLLSTIGGLNSTISSLTDRIVDLENGAGSSGGAAENVRIIRGRIGLAFPTSGAGWSAVRLGLGNYQVTWTVTVPNDVTLLPSPGTSITGALFGYSFSPGGTPDSTGFTIAVYRWDGDSWELDDVGLSFLAIWGI